MRSSAAKIAVLLAAPAALLLMLSGAAINSRATTTTPSTGPTTGPAPAFTRDGLLRHELRALPRPAGKFFYGPTLGQDLTDAQLQKAVNDMASGAGNAPLAVDELPVETAFHRALIMRKPFLSVTQMDTNGKWAGEAMPDAKVALFIGQTKIAATSDGFIWTAQLPAGAKASDVKITAQLAGAVTSLDPSREKLFEHRPNPAGG